MCNAYEQLSILYFFKTFSIALLILIPIFLTVSASRDILKRILKNNISYKRPVKKIVLSFIVLFLSVLINDLNIFSNSKLLSCWDDANIENLAVLQNSNSSSLAYVPVVVEPIYIKNPYKVDINAIKQKVQNIIGNKDISISFYSPKTAQGFNINGDKIYVAASVSKIHAVLNVYDWAYENNIDLKDVYMTYTSSDFQGGSGILQSSPSLKTKRYSLYELCELSITESDNIAWNMIRRYMSNKRSNTTYYKDLVDSNNVIVNGTYAMTANWAVDIMKKVYYNEDNNPYYEKMIIDMKNTSQTKLAAYLEEGIVAHKTGVLYLNGFLYANDAGIVYSDSEYILSIFTKSKMSDESMSSLIGEISLAIYEEIFKN